MTKFITPFRVGLLVLASGAFLFAFLTFVRKGGMSDDESLKAYAYFSDASGLGKRSRVQVAGIPVGEIDRIELEGSRAKIFLKIQSGIGVHKDAVLKKRSESLLGDYQLELTLGTDAAPLLQDGDQIVRVQDRQPLDAIMEQVDRISGDVQAVTASLRKVLGGDEGAANLQKIIDNLVSTSQGVNDTVQQSQKQLDTILANFEVISRDVRGITHGNQDELNQIIANINAAAADTRDIIASVKRVVGDGKTDGVQQDLATLRKTISRLDNTLANLEEVTTKVKEGKGAVGTLLTDERVGQKISETVEDISDFAGRLTQVKTEVSLRSEYLFAQGGAKNFVSLRLVPKPDKYYLIELVDDARGEIETTVIQTNPPNAGQPATQIQRITRDRLRFTAQFAKRYYWLTLRFGLTESTGGVGADAHFFNDHLSLRVDAFNFSVQELRYPRIRAALRFQAFEHLFATVGVDDMLNRQVRDDFTRNLLSGRDFFVGAGVYFTDDDLKSLLPIVPLP